MISWIQRTFQQHFKWLFLALLVVVIISFVFITNTSSGLGHAAPQAPSRPFFGLNLNSEEDMRRLNEDAALSAQLQRLPIRSEEQLGQYALYRHAALHLADQLNLPAPSTEELARHVQTLGAFTGVDGKFDAKRYADFRDGLKTNPQIRESDVSRVLADDVIYQKVMKLLGGPGYVLPIDVQNALNRTEATWTLETVTVDYDTFKPAINVTDEALAKHFEFNASRYQIAPQVGVSYVDFPAAAFTDKIAVTEEGLRAYYDANSTRFLKPIDDKNPAPATPDAAFAAARKEVEDAYRKERAQALAINAASDLAVALYDNKISPANLERFLASRGLALKKLAPFNAQNVPAELGTDRRIASEALKTSAEHPYSEPVNTGRGAALLVWNESVPARIPALAEVKDKVTADYLEAEKRKQFAEAGRKLRDALAARLKAGDTLAKAVASSANVIPAKLAHKSLPAFSLANPPQDIDFSLYRLLEEGTLAKGELSPMITNVEQGLIAYAADKAVPATDPASPKFAATRERLAASTAFRNGGERLGALIQAELAKSAPVTR